MTKRVLITGKDSYIGTSFINYCQGNKYDLIIDEVSSQDGAWKEANFEQYDVVFHVAGIAHNSSDSKLRNLYYSVNRDLTIQVANKAKDAGVKQFIFMSSIIVYGSKNEIIDENTKTDPDNFYGDSKLQAEKKIIQLENSDFNVVVVRPPMVYGPNSKGNFPTLVKFAKFTPLFPNYNNKRSMIYIDNLLELIYQIIIQNKRGFFHPQNKEYVNTSDLIYTIAKMHRHSLWKPTVFNKLISKLEKITIFKKIFGNLIYSKELSHYRQINYQKIDFIESLQRLKD